MATILTSRPTPSRVPRAMASRLLESWRGGSQCTPSSSPSVAGIIIRATMTAAGALMMEAIRSCAGMEEVTTERILA